MLCKFMNCEGDLTMTITMTVVFGKEMSTE